MKGMTEETTGAEGASEKRSQVPKEGPGAPASVVPSAAEYRSQVSNTRPFDKLKAGSGVPTNPTPTYEGDFVLEEHLLLECGRTLAGVTLHYAVYGRLNAARDNAVLVCHALSGSALVGQWWPEVFRPGALLRLDQDFVICINLLGSCYGSTGPGSVNPETGEPYGADFPLVSIRDNVRAQAKLLQSLGVRKLRLVLGGSMGGMQAL